jgi:hypothetical protein
LSDVYAAEQGEFILLGGQISNKHPEYKTIAQLDPKSAFIVQLLDNLQKIMEKSPLDAARELIYMKGQINFMASCGELTKLSAIMGDTRNRYSSKSLKDVLRNIRLRSGNTPTTP